MIDLPSLVAAVSVGVIGLGGSVLAYTYADRFQEVYGPMNKRIADEYLNQFHAALREASGAITGSGSSAEIAVALRKLAQIATKSEGARGNITVGITRLRRVAFGIALASLTLAGGLVLLALGTFDTFLLALVSFIAASVSSAFAISVLYDYTGLTSFIQRQSSDLEVPELRT